MTCGLLLDDAVVLRSLAAQRHHRGEHLLAGFGGQVDILDHRPVCFA